VAIEQYYRSSKTEQKIRPRTSSSRLKTCAPSSNGLAPCMTRSRGDRGRQPRGHRGGRAGQIEQTRPSG